MGEDNTEMLDLMDRLRSMEIDANRINELIEESAVQLAEEQKKAVAAEKRVAELERELQQEKDDHADTKRERNDARDERDDFRDQFRDMREKRDEILATCKTYEADFQAWRAMIRARDAFRDYQNPPAEVFAGSNDWLEKEWLKLEQLSAKVAGEAWQGD